MIAIIEFEIKRRSKKELSFVVAENFDEKKTDFF